MDFYIQHRLLQWIRKYPLQLIFFFNHHLSFLVLSPNYIVNVCFIHMGLPLIFVPLKLCWSISPTGIFPQNVSCSVEPLFATSALLSIKLAYWNSMSLQLWIFKDFLVLIQCKLQHSRHDTWLMLLYISEFFTPGTGP